MPGPYRAAGPRFFRTAAAFGRWLATNHARKTEIWVGLYKKHAAHRGMTYPEAVDEALCWGWIDGVIYRVDDDRTAQRYTPRKAKSTWSLVNLRKVGRLLAAGRMQAPGLAAFERRDPARTGIYSFEKAPAVLNAEQTRQFKRSVRGWKWFTAAAPSYQRVALHWVVSAKQEATRERRLVTLIERSAKGERLRQFTPMNARKKR